MALAILAGGCSLLTPLDELTAGSHRDAGLESGTADAGAGADAGADASARFCALRPHAFCSDFDGDDPYSPWKVRTQEAPGALEITSVRSVSSPRALHAHNPRQTSSKHYVTLEQPFTGAWRRVVVDFDMYLENPSFLAGDSDFGLLGIFFSSTGAEQVLALGVGAAESGISLKSGGQDRPDLAASAGAMTYDQWVHLHVDMSPGGAVTGTLGTLSYATTLPVLAAGASPSIRLLVGALCFNVPLPEINLFIDNVTIDFP